MGDYLKLKKSNCKNCYKCIRHCPVKSIQFFSNQANIVGDECILCGQCFVACPQNAKEIRDDRLRAKALIEAENKVIASVAPSFTANYGGISMKAMERALQQLGFAAARETAEGAYIVKSEYERMIREKSSKVIISSCCHSVNLLIQKHFPEALPYLAPVVSPMQINCMTIKDEYPEAKTVFIGPCISKKEEAEKYPGTVDIVLTFEELTAWMEAESVSFEEIPENKEESKTRLFPTSGGILKTMDLSSKDYGYMTVDGLENCMIALKDIVSGDLSNCFIEMSACSGSCIGGPIMEKNHHTPVRDNLMIQKYSGRKDFVLDLPERSLLRKEHKFIGIHKQMPGSETLKEILKKMGKTRPEHELNCGTCGYNTCREKAIAVYQGKADLSMCLPFLKEKAESFSDTIIKNTPNAILVLNEQLEVQQINSAATKLLNIHRATDILGEPVIRVLDPSLFFEVIETGKNIKDAKAYLAEYQKYIEQTVIYDKSYHVIICLMKDITEAEKQRVEKEEISQHTIEIADKVIEKQMRVVQEIASLLGETTAETQVALTKLKESLKDE